MPDTSSTSPRLKPCLNCGEQMERDSAVCWHCGAKRGSLQFPKGEDVLNEVDTNPLSNGHSSSQKAEDEKTGRVVSKLSKIITGSIQALIAIPIILYLGGALLSLLILFFFVVPVVIPIVFKISYLDYVRSALRDAGRSPFYVSLVSTTCSIGFLFLCGFLFGRRRMIVRFEDVVKEDRIKRIDKYLFLPCPDNMRAKDHYKHRHMGILILPKREYGWRSIITALGLLTALSAVIFVSMIAKDYFVLKAGARYIPSAVNALADLVLLWGALVIGAKLGREVIKSKIGGDWGWASSGSSDRANIVGNYLCTPVLGLPSYIVVYLLGVDDLSFDEANKVYLKYRFMISNEVDLTEWSKTDPMIE